MSRLTVSCQIGRSLKVRAELFDADLADAEGRYKEADETLLRVSKRMIGWDPCRTSRSRKALVVMQGILVNRRVA